LAIFVFVGAVSGVGVFLLPEKYITTGSFYVKRAPQDSGEFFTYEGYYGQQASLAYTNTVFALLESIDLESMALKKLGAPVDELTLRKLHKKISVKKSGPQLISLTVKDLSPNESKKVWNALSDALLETTNKINFDGDTALSISQVSPEPVVKKAYNNLVLTVLIGVSFGFATSVFVLSLKEYTKEEKSS